MDVFKKISAQTGMEFVVTNNMLSGAKPVTIRVNSGEIREVLNLIFENQPLTYTLRKNAVVVKRKSSNSITSNLAETPDWKPTDVRVTVVDERNRPVQSVTVTMENTSIIGMTDSQGNVSFKGIPGEGFLIFTSIGYEKHRAAVRDVNGTRLTLKTQLNKLEEVSIVSTGYQKIEKERASGSFSKPDMELFQQRTGTMDIINRLEGLVPGLVVTPGRAGLSENNMRVKNGYTTQRSTIRGESSINLNTDPLYVVDGVPVTNINLFNPDDIGDITVLKDAAAAAIWGAKAANGVIVINTKSASKKAPLKLSYSSFFNFQGKPDYSYGKAMNSAQYIQAVRETFSATAFPYASLTNAVVTPHEQILYDQSMGRISLAQANRSLDSLSEINNLDQIYDLWYQDALTQSHTLSVSGGSPNYSFYSSVGYTNNKSNRVGENSQNYRLTLNQNYSPFKNLSISLSTALGNIIGEGQNAIGIGNDFLPYQLFVDQNGNSQSMPYLSGFTREQRLDYEPRSRLSLDYNPLDELNYKRLKQNNLHINLSGGINLKIIDGLSFVGSYGYQKAPGQRKEYTDNRALFPRKNILNLTVAPTVNSTPVYYLPTTGSTFVEDNFDDRNWTLRNQLAFNKTLRGNRDRINLQVGQEARESFVSSTTNTLYGYDEQLMTYSLLNYGLMVRGTITGAGMVPTANNTSIYETKTRFTSYFALANYTFNNKYSLDASWRTDHSALFGSDHSAQNRPIWSIGGKWNIRNESFLDDHAQWLNALALRATYGITGNSPYTGAAAQWDIVEATYPMSGNSGPYMLITARNPGLSWEASTTRNFGLDFSILNSRLSGSLDAYIKNTENLLGEVVLNPFTGYKRATGNLGNLSNKGIELALQSVNIRTKKFSWTSALNFAYNRNRLLSYSAMDPRSNNSTTLISGLPYMVGYNNDPLFSYNYAGLNNQGNPMVKLADGKITADPYITKPEDLVYSGTTTPKYNGGLTNSFRYRAFALSGNIIFNLGHVMRADVNQVYSTRITTGSGAFSGNLTTYFMDRWKKPGDENFTDIPSYIPGVASSTTRNVDYYTRANTNVLDASYAKLRDVTLSYNLPSSVLRQVKIKTASIALQLNNFLLWTANDRDIDPEFADLKSGGRSLPPNKHAVSIQTNITF